ncbi:hypothetical protein SRHO_G00155040 [Serrasalmus rhombeus]
MDAYLCLHQQAVPLSHTSRQAELCWRSYGHICLLVVRDQTELTSPADVVNPGLLRQPTSLASSGPSD